MLDFIQLIVGVVSKAIPSIIRNRKAGQLDQIGVELFWFYIRVNEALMEGEHIIVNLEHFANSGQMPGEPRFHAEDAQRVIAKLVPRQFQNLVRIVDIVRQWGGQLQILDGRSYAKLMPLLYFKANALRVLWSTIICGDLPLSVTAEDFEKLEVAKSRGLFGGQSLEYLSIEQNLGFRAALMRESIPLNSPWDESEVRQAIKIYLRDRNPTEQLNQMRAALEDIRAALVDTFSVPDILLRVDYSKYRVDTFLYE